MVTIEGGDYDWFRGSGYLGLYGHPEILAASTEATLKYGLKTRVKKEIGCHPVVHDLERNAIEFFGSQAVVFFNS